MAAIELKTYRRPSNQQRHACREACAECLVACEMCSDACLDEDNVKMLSRCIRLDRDCADACAIAVRAMARGRTARGGDLPDVRRGLRGGV